MSFLKRSIYESEDYVLKAMSASRCAKTQDHTKGSVHHIIGRFEIDFKMTSMQKSIIERLQFVYTDDMIERILRPMLEQHEGWPSCRCVDWLLTNYSKSRRVICNGAANERINVFVAYKSMLAFFRRRNFDAFKRRLRIKIHTRSGVLESTIAQVNFYAWAHQTGILQWCKDHADDIQKDMNEVASRRRVRNGERRRTELSAAPCSKITVYDGLR